jgi:hypothetical protein
VAETASDIFVDLTNRSFVASAKGGSKVGPFSSPFHQDKFYLNVQPITADPGSTSSAPFKVVDAANFSLTILITKTDGTTLVGPITTFTPNGLAKLGSLDLNTAAMATAFTSPSTTSVDAYVYFQFDDGSNTKITIKGDFSIKRTYITTGTPTEQPLATYLTRDECIALFVRFAGNPAGSSITLPDSTSTYNLILKCNTDGSNASDASN